MLSREAYNHKVPDRNGGEVGRIMENLKGRMGYWYLYKYVYIIYIHIYTYVLYDYRKNNGFL